MSEHTPKKSPTFAHSAVRLSQGPITWHSMSIYASHYLFYPLLTYMPQTQADARP